MNRNKTEQSGFQFSNPSIKKVLLEANENFDKNSFSGMPVSYGIECSPIKNNSATVALQMMIGEQGEEVATPFLLILEISSEFRWTDDAAHMSEKLLKQNAVTLLLSYARPFVAHLTADAGFSPFNIPFLDVRRDIANME